MCMTRLVPVLLLGQVQASAIVRIPDYCAAHFLLRGGGGVETDTWCFGLLRMILRICGD